MVEFDDSVGSFHGRVVNSGSDPVASFEAADTGGIEKEFRRSIDEYIASCKEDGSEPIKLSGSQLKVVKTTENSSSISKNV